jgi:hypothetical protein
MGLKKFVKKATKIVTNPGSAIKLVTNITKKVDPLGIGAGGLKKGSVGWFF